MVNNVAIRHVNRIFPLDNFDYKLREENTPYQNIKTFNHKNTLIVQYEII